MLTLLRRVTRTSHVIGFAAGYFFKVSYIILIHILILVKSSGNHFHFLKELFDMFRFAITELKYRALCVRKTWRSFLSLLPQMSHFSQSIKGKMIF